MKYIKALPNALLSLQFWQKNGTPMFTITSNLGGKKTLDNSFTGIDFLMFGRKLAENELLDKHDKESVSQFCRSYLKEVGKYNKNRP